MKGRSLVTYFGILSLLLIISVGQVLAQGVGEWLPFEHVPGYQDDTFPPYLVADQNRTVHAFTSEPVGEYLPQKAIIYRQWTLEQGWTSPVDILLSPSGDAEMPSAFLDKAGWMHLIFRGGQTQGANIYYSRAPVASAGRAPSWFPPELVGGNAFSDAGSSAIAGDDAGNLVVIYNGNIAGSGVYAIHSSNGGETWSEPAPIFLTLDSDLIPFSLQLVMGQAGQMHAVWNVVTATGVDLSLHYARLDVANQIWSDPILLDERVEEGDAFGPSFPSIVANGDEVVVMYNNGNPTEGGSVAVGRPVQRVRMSGDNGITWNDPTGPFPRLQGRSGSHALVVDSSGVVHALFIQRIDESVDGRYSIIGGMWHSELRDQGWTVPDRIVMGISGHDLQAVVSQGNTLLVVMREDPGVGQSGIWYTYTILEAPELPVVTVPTLQVPHTPTPRPSETPPSPTPMPSPTPIMIGQGNDSPTSVNGPSVFLAVGVAPVILILVGIVVVQQLSRYRRH